MQTIIFFSQWDRTLDIMHTSSEPLSPIRNSRTSSKGQIVILKDNRHFISNDHRLFCFSPTEHVCSIIMWLFRNLSGNLRTRLVQKFVENDHIKVDRLMELHFKYHSKIQECDTKIEKEKQVSNYNLSFEALTLTVANVSRLSAIKALARFIGRNKSLVAEWLDCYRYSSLRNRSFGYQSFRYKLKQ